MSPSLPSPPISAERDDEQTETLLPHHASSPTNYHIGLIRELVIVFGFYYVYQTVRRLARNGGTAPAAFRNARRLIDWERTLHVFNEQSVQHAFLATTWLIKALNIYYGTLHFFVTGGLLIWVFVRRHLFYRRFRNLLGLTTALALFGFWLFPLAPPRMQTGFVDTLDVFGGMWSYRSPLAKAVANPFAAMPSLHFGWSLWCALIVFTLSRRRLSRVLGVLYPTLTLFSIVVTANHYWLDAAGGVVIFGAAFGLLTGISRLRHRTPRLATTGLRSG